MSKKLQSRRRWSLTLIRDGTQVAVNSVAEARFLFGRWTNEIIRSHERSDHRVIPSGVIRALESAQISDQALESGFELEMSLSGRKENGWIPFDIALAVTSDKMYERPSFLFVSPNDESTLNMVQIALGFCGEPVIEPPSRLWIRAKELPERYLFWALDNDLLKCEGNSHEQMSLAHWFELPELDLVGQTKELSLPGPPPDPYDFFSTNLY